MKGRPRHFQSNAERQKAYRERVALQKPQKVAEPTFVTRLDQLHHEYEVIRHDFGYWGGTSTAP